MSFIHKMLTANEMHLDFMRGRGTNGAVFLLTRLQEEPCVNGGKGCMYVL